MRSINIINTKINLEILKEEVRRCGLATEYVTQQIVYCCRISIPTGCKSKPVEMIDYEVNNKDQILRKGLAFGRLSLFKMTKRFVAERKKALSNKSGHPSLYQLRMKAIYSLETALKSADANNPQMTFVNFMAGTATHSNLLALCAYDTEAQQVYESHQMRATAIHYLSNWIKLQESKLIKS